MSKSKIKVSEMKDLNTLQDLNIETPEECFGFLRRTEMILDCDLYRSLGIYILSLLVIFSTFYLGPQCLRTVEKDFNISNSSTHIAFDISIDGLNHYNSFLKFQISFPTKDVLDTKSVPFNLAFNSHQYLNNILVHEIHIPYRNYSLNFVRGSKYSQALRVFSCEDLDFTHTNSSIIISFENEPYPVHFIATTVSSSYVQYTYFIYFVGFVMSAILLMNLISFRLSFYINAIYFMQILLSAIVLLICSFPRPLLQSIVGKSNINIVNTFLAQFLFVFTCYIGFVHLDAGKQVNQQMNYTYSFFTSIFFIAFFLLMFVYSFKYSLKNTTNQIIQPDITTTGFSIAKYALIALYIPFLYLFNYMADYYNKVDQFVHFCMPICFVMFTAVTEFLTPSIVGVEMNFSLQIYTFAASIPYIFFYAYLNWPISEKK